MYEFYYNNITSIRFYPIIKELKYVYERDAENPFIIRESLVGALSVTGADFDFFETFKGTSNEITGTFREVIIGTKSYDCFFKVNNDINYSTKFLTISVRITDRYSNLLDNPEKNVDTEFDYTIDPQFITTDTQAYGGGVDVKKIINEFLAEIDSTINVNIDTYAFLTANNYNYMFLSNVENYDKTTNETLVPLSEINLKTILEFLSFNSGMQVYLYIDSSNNAVFEHISNLIQGSFVLNLTDYNGIDWTKQKQDITTSEEKFSLMRYRNLGLQAEFKNINCFFPKNSKNESEYVYNFLVDIEKTETENNGRLISNANKTGSDTITSELVNNSLDVFTSNNFGKDNAGSNNTGAHQFAEQFVSETFTASIYQQIELSWTNNISPFGKVEIYNENLNSIAASFNISSGIGLFTFLKTDSYRIRLSLYGSGESFDISNFTVNLIEYVVRKVTVIGNDIENYEFSPKHIIENFGGNFPDSEGVIDKIEEVGLNKKPSEVEEIDFPFNDLLSAFDFSKYVKTNISEEMIPYKIERTVLDLNEKGFDRLTLKKR